VLQPQWPKMGERKQYKMFVWNKEVTWNQLPGDLVLLRPKKMPASPLPALTPPPAVPAIGLDDRIKVWIMQEQLEANPIEWWLDVSVTASITCTIHQSCPKITRLLSPAHARARSRPVIADTIARNPVDQSAPDYPREGTRWLRRRPAIPFAP
jgi:hypothetical protein